MRKDKINDKLLEGLLDYGFSIFLVLHMLRYSKENNIKIPEIIKILADGGIPEKYAAYVSFSGYNSFKNMINLCQGSPIETIRSKPQ